VLKLFHQICIMKKFFQFSLIILAILLSLYINYYYLQVNNFDAVRNLPQSVLTAIIAFLAVQLIKRSIKKKNAWYDWIYYAGLMGILSPLLLVTSTADWLLQLAKYSGLFILLSPSLELFFHFKEK
jgi:cellobiose-specific phosphotransferase system component IIC